MALTPHAKKHVRLLVLSTVSAMSFLGALGVSPNAEAAVVLAPIPGSGPTLSVVKPDLTPKLDTNGNQQTTPQVGTLLLADPGTWNDMAGTTFTYEWATVDASSTSTPITTGRNATKWTAKDYVPVVANIGFSISVTVTATNTANGDTAGSATFVTTASAVGLNPGVTTAPPATNTNTPYVDAFGSVPPANAEAYLTMYGYPDNTPPSAGIAYARNGGNTTFPNHTVGRGIHTEASGTGTYEDPISFATSNTELTPGTEIYVPRFNKYFIMEDSCTECGQDMSGAQPYNPDGTVGTGPSGGPGMIHIDLWVGGKDADWPDIILCEDALTLYDGDTPHMDPIILNPGPNEKVVTTPIFDPATGKCNVQPDGSSTPLDTGLTVGHYVNIPGPTGATGTPNGTNMCITNPGNSTDVGTQLTMEPCDDSRADQNVSFGGAFLLFNNLCLDNSNGMGTFTATTVNGVQAYPVTLQRCNLNAGQQWELNVDGTITDIQNSRYSFADLGDGKLYTSRNNNSAFNYWDFPFLRGVDNEAVVNVSETSILPGATIAVGGSGLTTPTAEIRLVSATDPDGILLTTVTAAADGTFDATVVIGDSVAPGTYQIQVRGLTNVIPTSSNGSSTSITDVAQIPASFTATLANFAPLNRTAPITGFSASITVTAIPATPQTPTTPVRAAPAGGGVSGSTSLWLWGSALLAAAGTCLLVQRRKRRTDV